MNAFEFRLIVILMSLLAFNCGFFVGITVQMLREDRERRDAESGKEAKP